MDQKLNDLTGLVEGVFSTNGNQNNPIAQPFTFAEGVQYTPFTLNRVAVSYGYIGYGLVQTMIDLPVEDAFRGGIEIESEELDVEDIAALHKFMEENEDIEALKEALKWSRLYGGGALLIETEDQDTRQPLNSKSLKHDSVLRFIPADRWELCLTSPDISANSLMKGTYSSGQAKEIPYIYYSTPLHKSRVIKIMGKPAPAFIRLRLQGWAMSELERCMRDITSFLKFQNMIFELIDEAKIDIFKIKEFNNALASAEGTELINNRIQLNALLKNFKNSTVMDAEDDFEQKQLTFGGLADIYQEIRQNLCAAIGIPESKLFGKPSSGFSSGQDSIENYNALVESGVRTNCKKTLIEIISLRCQQLFGFVPQFVVKFKPLKMLSEVDEEVVMTSKQARSHSLFDRGLYTAKELLDSLDKDGLLNISTEIQQGLRDLPMNDGNDGFDLETKQKVSLDEHAKKTREESALKDEKIMAFKKPRKE